MTGVRRFEDFICWQLAYELQQALLQLARRREVERDFKFRGQIRDAGASAPRNIAEGFGRHTDDDFARFLDIARGSLMECQQHLRDAADRGYLDISERDRLIVLARRAGGAVAGLQRHLRRKKR